jgi:hypothetical protein
VNQFSRLAPAMAMVVIAATTVVTGCDGGPRHAAAAGPVTVAVSQARALRVTVPGVATVTGQRGAFRGRGKITVRPVRARLPFGNSLAAAGTGIDVTFSGVTLSRPLTIAFDITGKRKPGDVAVIAHQLPGGGWDLARATAAGTQMTVRASSFSPHLPAWLHPDAWLRWLGDRLASLIGGRTPPIKCAGGGPAWARLSKQTREVHTCLVPNVDAASHDMRAEVQIKSNRGTALEVDIPPDAAYTWVQDQPWAVRSWVWAHLIHEDPNLIALLPAGGTLTVGYLRPDASEDLSFQVRPSGWSLGYTLIGDIVDVLSGKAADATSLTTLYLLAKCSEAVDYGSLSAHNPLSTVTFSSAFKCVLNEALSGLSSPKKAAGAARSLLGPGVDEAGLATATKELTSVGGKLLTFGWVLRLWPFFQAGWGTIPDAIHNLLTSGASALVNLHLSAHPAPPCSASLLFAAAVAGQHFSTNPALYPHDPGQGPGAYDPVCDGTWAIAAVSHPRVGTTDGEVLFQAQGGSWSYVASIGGVPADCILEQSGVPAAVAKVLWPPSQSQPASYCTG